MKSSSTSGGNARKKSTYATTIQLSQRRRSVGSTATSSPPASPSGMTSRLRSSVVPNPLRRYGKTFAAISGLRNCWRIASMSPSRYEDRFQPLTLPRKPRLHPPPEDHERDEEHEVGDRPERERRRVAGKARRRVRRTEDLRQRDDRAERSALGDRDRAVGERRDRNAERLRDDDVDECLQAVHPGRAGRLVLTLRDRDDSGPEDLLRERAEDQGQREPGRGERAHRQSGVREREEQDDDHH